VSRDRVNAALPGAQPLGSKSAMLDLEFAEISDRGPVREDNEDFIRPSLPSKPEQVRTRGWIFALADGVGGQDHGEVAAQLAVETVLAEWARAAPGENPATLLTRAIQTANARVYEAGHGAIASTLVACALRFDRATVAHVGDSRCYLIRHGRPRLLTRDHTVINDQVRLGLFGGEEAQQAVTRNVLSRSIGNDLFVAPEIGEHNLKPGDLLLLCSDGLHGSVPDDKIALTAASGGGLKDVTQQLIAIANQSDGGDNVSIQLIRVKNVEAVGMYRGRPYRLH